MAVSTVPEKTNQEKRLLQDVETRVKQLKDDGLLTLPDDYAAGNAFRGAWMKIKETVDKDKKPALEVCSENSIQEAIFDMITKGLNASKSQGYFIVRGTKLCWQTSYFGNELLATRFGGLVWIRANVIYEGDTFTYEINNETALCKVLEHKQTLENIDITKIRGAYATYKLADGTVNVMPMTIKQIKESWNMGEMKGGGKSHLQFTDQACIKTVKNRVCKTLINTSSDAGLIGKQDLDNNQELANEPENTIDIGFTDADTNIETPAAAAQDPAQAAAAAAQTPQQKQAKAETPTAPIAAEGKPTAAKLDF